MSSPSDTTKPFFAGDSAKVLFKINPATHHLDVQIPNGDHIDVDGGHFVEVKYHEGRALFTRRPFPRMPTYEEMWNVMLAAGTFDQQVVEALRLVGVKGAKPTPESDDSTADLENQVG